MTTDRITWESPPLPEWAQAILGSEETLAGCRLGSAGVPHLDVMCAVDRAYPGRSADETLAVVDATVEGRCAGPDCGIPLTADSPSGWWCSPDCQATYYRQGAIRPGEVRGSTDVAADPARWRPDLVDVFDDSDLTLLSEQEVGPRGPTRRVYLHRDGRMFLRLDNGNRFVGTFMERDEYATTSGLGELGAVWSRLERELTDPRRLADDRDGVERFADGLAAMYSRHRTGVAAWEAEHPRGWYWCDSCQQTGEPELDRDDDPDLFTFRAERLQLRRPRCPHCHATVPQDLCLTVQREDDGGQLVRVERGGRQAEYSLSGWYLREADDPQTVILRTWVQLQRDVAPAGGLSAQHVWTIVDDPVDWSRLDRRAEGDGSPLAVTVDPQPGHPAAGAVFWMADPPADPEAPTPAELEGGIDLTPYLAPAQDSFRRVGERLLSEGGPVAGAIAAYQNLPEVTRAAVEVEQDRLTLRALCADEAEYERALRAARDHGLTVREVAEMLAVGQAIGAEGYSTSALDRLMQTADRDMAGIVTTVPPPPTGEDIMADLLAAYEQLEAVGRNPPVRMDTSPAVLDQLRSQAEPARPPLDPLRLLMGIPIVPDPSMPPEAWRLEYADGQRREIHTCRWEHPRYRRPEDWRAGPERYGCCLHWSDGTRCDEMTTDPSVVRRTERLVGPSATGGGS